MQAKIFKIYGKVQNVGFRFYTHKTALKYNIKGFVKNENDGSVYVEAEGDALNILAFEFWCKQGPKWSRVDDFKSSDKPVQNFFDFSIR